ncbi:DUF2291 family protein [Vreelandella alkaliphila]|uniref:DUF2291 family protein n=1 Tax=Halomonadaceae TaxID=28256 RepID=UPI0018671EF0|nr:MULTISPECIES: DUF2291 domain-containing protein [unclassified Halomonas]
MTATINFASKASGKHRGAYVLGALTLLLVILMMMDTHTVKISELEDSGEFSQQRFGEENFPSIQEYIQANAISAEELAAEVLEDAGAAGQAYGVAAGIGHIVPVTMTGVAEAGQSGIYSLDIEGVPDDITIRVQTGPVINGTTLRDATGDIAFGNFTNQIEYQDAGAALNEEMKRQVLEGISELDLTGKTLEVVGAFMLLNPSHWLVTPVQLNVSE